MVFRVQQMAFRGVRSGLARVDRAWGRREPFRSKAARPAGHAAAVSLKQAVASRKAEAGGGVAALWLPQDKGCRRLYAPIEGCQRCLVFARKLGREAIAQPG